MSEGGIEIKNCGPISYLRIPVSEPGLFVLSGANGSGKSTALSAIQSLMTGDGKPPVKRGEKEAEVVGFGARLVVSGANGRKGQYGEFQVSNLESDYSIADFVNPGVKDEKVADAKRIKALVKMFGVEADKNLFMSFFAGPEEFNQIVQSDTAALSCPVEMAARLKRDVELAARNLEAAAQDKKSKSEALMASLPKEFSGQPSEGMEALEAALSAAQKAAADARFQKQVADSSAKERKTITDLLAAMEKVDLNDLVAEGVNLNATISKQESIVADLRERLVAAEKTLSELISNRESMRREFEQSQRRNAQIEEMEKKLRESVADGPSDEEIDGLDAAVQGWASRISAKKLEIQSADNLTKAKGFLFEAEEKTLLAQHYRRIASQVESSLVSIVNQSGCGMSVEDGRIVLDIGDGKEFISELSEGERFRVAIKCKIAAMRSRFPDKMPIAVIPQEAFEVLQPSVQKEIAELLRAEGAVGVTAMPSDVPEIQIVEAT